MWPRSSRCSSNPGDLLAAWKRGDIDATYVWGPFSQQLEAENGQGELRPEDLPASFAPFIDSTFLIKAVAGQ